MFKNIRDGLKVMKYGIQYKQMMFLMVIFFVLGIVMQFVMGNDQRPLGDMYLALVPGYSLQLIISTYLSKFALASPEKKRYTVDIPITIVAAGEFITYTLNMGITCLRAYVIGGGNPEMAKLCVNSALFGGFMVLLVQVYISIAYKFFIASMLMFFALFFPSYLFFSRNYMTLDLGLQHWQAVLIGYAMVAVGTAISYLIGVLTYRRPYDTWYFKRAIAQANK